jgi:integrase
MAMTKTRKKMSDNEKETMEDSSNWLDQEIAKAVKVMLPKASKEHYERTYEKFNNWRKEKKLEGKTSEKEVFAYLFHMMESGKWQSPGTIWSKFSMLKTMILSQEGLDIKETAMNNKIQTWLKRLSAPHKVKQANMFTKEEVSRYLKEAPASYLDHKLILLVGIYTGLRCDTISRLEWRHIDMANSKVHIFVDYDSKTDQGANGTWFSFPSNSADPALDPFLLFSKYKVMLEKKDTKLTNGRLWLRIIQEKDGTYKVTRQVRGKEWISDVPKKVAEYLKLPDAEKYTGHSFRRTCAQWAVNAGMTETQLQHHFGWKSSSMITKYSRSSTHLKETAAACLDLEGGQKSVGAKWQPGGNLTDVQQQKSERQNDPIGSNNKNRLLVGETAEQQETTAGSSGEVRKKIIN